MDRQVIEEILLNYLLPPDLVTAITDDIMAAIAADLDAALPEEGGTPCPS